MSTDRIEELARENEVMVDYLRKAANTIKCVVNHYEAGFATPEWVIQDCRIALVYIGAQIKENTL